MVEDEIMQELRRVREECAAHFDYDLTAMCHDLKQREQGGGWKLVSFAREDKSAEADHYKIPLAKAS